MDVARDHFLDLAREYTPCRDYAQDICMLAETTDAYGMGMDASFCDAVLQFAAKALPTLVVPVRALQQMARAALQPTLAYLFIASKDLDAFRTLAPVLVDVADVLGAHASTDTAALGLVVSCADPPDVHVPLCTAAMKLLLASSLSLPEADAVLLVEGFEVPLLVLDIVRGGHGGPALAELALCLLGNLSCLYTVARAAWMDTFRASYGAVDTLVQRASGGHFALSSTMVREVFRYLGNVLGMVAYHNDGSKAGDVVDAGVWSAAMALVPVAAAHVAADESVAQSILQFYKLAIRAAKTNIDYSAEGDQVSSLARGALGAHTASVPVTLEAILLCGTLVFVYPSTRTGHASSADLVYAAGEAFSANASIAAAVVSYVRNTTSFGGDALTPLDFARGRDAVRAALTRHMASVRVVRECFSWLWHVVKMAHGLHPARALTAVEFLPFVDPVLSLYAATEYDLVGDAFLVLAYAMERQLVAAANAPDKARVRAWFLPYAKHVLPAMAPRGYADNSVWAFLLLAHPHPGIVIPLACVLGSFRRTYNWSSLLCYIMVAYVHDAPTMAVILDAVAWVAGDKCPLSEADSRLQRDVCLFLADVLARTQDRYRALIAKRFVLTLAAQAASPRPSVSENAARALVAVLPSVTSKLPLVSALCSGMHHLHPAIEAQRAVLDSRWTRPRSAWCCAVFRAPSTARFMSVPSMHM